MFEREYRDLAHVPRWSIIPTIQKQSVAEHSYYVTLYAYQIMLKLRLDPRFTLVGLYHCLEHDRSECYTSDIPGPTKRHIVDKDKEFLFEVKSDAARFETHKWDKKDLAGMPVGTAPIVLAVRKLADLMDEFAFWKEEGKLGNARAGQMLRAIRVRLDAAATNLGEATNNRAEVWDRVVNPFIAGCDKDKVVPEENSDVVA